MDPLLSTLNLTWQYSISFLVKTYYVEGIEGLIGGLIFHTALWLWLSHWDTKVSPIWKIANFFLNFDERIKENIIKNARIKSDNMNIKGDDWFCMYVITLFHHVAGGVLMLYGIVFNAPHIWAHGLLNEVGGLDLRDYIQIFLYKANICPKISPWSQYNYTAYFFWCTHHLVGLSLCYTLIFYFRDDRDCQMLG